MRIIQLRLLRNIMTKYQLNLYFNYVEFLVSI
jgi:hypothetical protein